jgi:hypothetical protein
MIEINLSSSALSSAGCILALKRTVIDGYADIPSSNIVYGEAVHKYIDVMYRTSGHIPTAREEALKVFNQPKLDNRKSAHLSDSNHMITTCFGVWELWVKGEGHLDLVSIPCDPSTNGGKTERAATEVTFSIEYYQDSYIKVNLCGTIDSIGKIPNGCFVIRDWKTTSSWDNKGYFFKYKLSKQLRFYRLALQLMSKMHPDSILGQIGSQQVGCCIDGLFIKPFANDNKYARSEVFMFSDEQLRNFKSTLDTFILKLSNHAANNDWPKEGILTGACEGKWGCPYTGICTVEEPLATVLLDRDFKRKVYNPLNYSGL